MSPKIQLSGLQKQVLALYRGFLRVARLKSPEERQRIEDLISAEFRKKSTSVDRKNFMYIEYLLRTGAKQLQQLSNPVTVGVSSFQASSSSGTRGDEALTSVEVKPMANSMRKSLNGG